MFKIFKKINYLDVIIYDVKNLYFFKGGFFTQ